jgi:hypothetical protein
MPSQKKKSSLYSLVEQSRKKYLCFFGISPSSGYTVVFVFDVEVINNFIKILE